MRYSWFSFGESKCKPWKGSAYDIEIENEWYKEQTKKAKMALILVNEMKRDLICSRFWIWGSTDLCVCVYLLWLFGKNHTAQKDQQLRTNGTTRNTFRNRFFFLSLSVINLYLVRRCIAFLFSSDLNAAARTQINQQAALSQHKQSPTSQIQANLFFYYCIVVINLKLETLPRRVCMHRLHWTG